MKKRQLDNDLLTNMLKPSPLSSHQHNVVINITIAESSVNLGRISGLLEYQIDHFTSNTDHFTSNDISLYGNFRLQIRHLAHIS